MMEVVIGAKAMAVEQAKDNDGSVEPFDDDVQKQMAKYAKTLSDKTAKNAGVPDAPSTLNTAGADWQKSVTELGLTTTRATSPISISGTRRTLTTTSSETQLFDTAMAEHRPE